MILLFSSRLWGEKQNPACCARVFMRATHASLFDNVTLQVQCNVEMEKETTSYSDDKRNEGLRCFNTLYGTGNKYCSSTRAHNGVPTRGNHVLLDAATIYDDTTARELPCRRRERVRACIQYTNACVRKSVHRTTPYFEEVTKHTYLGLCC